MTAGTFTRSQIALGIPRLLDRATVVALVPAGQDHGFAAEVAWRIARAVAARGRRVVLIDLSLEEPELRAERGEVLEGIVDAFLYGASLQHVACPQDVPGLFFIGAGTRPADPVEIWGHPRWERLARGFAQAEALLLLYAPREALDHLAISADRTLRLGTEVDTPLRPQPPGPVVAGGEPVIRVIPDPPPPKVPNIPTAAWSSHLQQHATSPSSRVRRTTVAALIVGGVALLALVLGLISKSSPPVDSLEPDSRVAPQAREDPNSSPAVVGNPVPTSAGDSLYYSIQVAAFKTPAPALEQAKDYERRGWTATVTPVRLGLGGIWHRVLIGAYRDPTAAGAALEELYRRGLLDRPRGTILRTPHTVRLGEYPDRRAARDAAAGLREAGVPAYIVVAPDSAAGVYAGAFEASDQARLLDSLLQSANLTGTVVLRTGTTP